MHRTRRPPRTRRSGEAGLLNGSRWFVSVCVDWSSRSPLQQSEEYPSGFASAPVSWHYFGSLREMASGPKAFEFPGGQKFVGYLTDDGRPVVMSARCYHMGADLTLGCVKGDRIACPFHNWEFGSDGRCVHIPASTTIPAFARQPSFPVEARAGHVFFFNALTARFPLPFFEDIEPDELRASSPFEMRDAVPWHFIGGNGFDLQHFRTAHDRVLVGEPTVDSSHPYARRIVLQFRVAGRSLADRITRWFAGPESTMSITSWCGSLILVSAKFRRATTYGVVAVKPTVGDGTQMRVIVWVRRSKGALSRRLFDPVNAAVRRWFIQRFLQSDMGRMSGVHYSPARLIGADNLFHDYMEWLRQVHR